MLLNLFLMLSFTLNAMEKPVLNGIDVLVANDFKELHGHAIGLITNHTGHNRERVSTIDLCFMNKNFTTKVLFSPEHGIRGILEGSIQNQTDTKTGLPIVSLYNGIGHQTIPEHALEGLTALVFDIQDIGCRFYTYISTLGHCLEQAAKAKLKFFVLDRVNPITGLKVSGPILSERTSFVRYHTIAIQHGMTAGELALMFNEEKNMQADLTIIKIQGWDRSMWFDQTSLGWTNPSPNIRNLRQAILYPAVAVIEYADISVGRGTDTPFEVIGAPYINEFELAKELAKENLKYVACTPTQFTPKAIKFVNQLCKGITIIVTDRDNFDAGEFGIILTSILYRLYKDQISLKNINILLGHNLIIKALENNEPLTKIKQLWSEDLNKFLERRRKFLLY